MLKICALASGSNGNAYYVEHQNEAVLIDAGISRRQLLQRMKVRNLSIDRVKAVFITHEHADHIRGFRVLCDKQNIPGYLTAKTAAKCRRDQLPVKVCLFMPGQVLEVGHFRVHSFAKSHDAADPCSFRVEAGALHVAVLTDLGVACEEVKTQLELCHAVFLESNYDEQLLLAGPYPEYLKKRVASDRGHLSNRQAVALIQNLQSPLLHTIFLSHISADNNRPDLALKAFEPLWSRYVVEATNRHAAGRLAEITTLHPMLEKCASSAGVL